MIQLTEDWKNPLVFPAVISATFVTGIILKSLFLLGITCYFVVILMIKKQKFLLFLSVIICLLLFLRFFQMRLPNIEVQPDQEITTSLQVFPDTIKVNGDQVTFEAKMSKGKASVQYKLSVEQRVP